MSVSFHTLAKHFSLAFAMLGGFLPTFSFGIRVATPHANTSIPHVLTALSRFDANSWTARHGKSWKIQASAHEPWRLPGTCVSERKMAALMRHSGTSLPKHAFLSPKMHMANVAERNNKSAVPRGVLQLGDLYGAEYVGELAVGTFEGAPQARLRAIYDTGSTDLWVLSDLCRHAPCAGEGRHVFDHRKSETFSAPRLPKQLATMYGSGEIYGLAGFDDVQVGPLVVQKQAMGLISEEVGEAFKALPFDGLVGLAFPKLAGLQGPGNEPLLDNLLKQENFATPWFAFFLHRDPTEGGAVLWGGIDDRLYEGPLQWFPVVEETYWTLDLLSFQVGDHLFDFSESVTTVQDKSGRVKVVRKPPAWQKPRLIVDSGTTFFTAPGYLFSAIASDTRFGIQKCSQLEELPSLVFVLTDDAGEKRELVVPAAEYMVKSLLSEDACYPGVIRMDVPETEQPLLIVGEVFMRHYFTVFSRGSGSESSRVGFARARDDAKVEELFTSSETS